MAHIIKCVDAFDRRVKEFDNCFKVVIWVLLGFYLSGKKTTLQ